ncbi:MAG: S8 family peptidase, partial [Candidatus Heimdallarchaeaceae archaeon]
MKRKAILGLVSTLLIILMIPSSYLWIPAIRAAETNFSEELVKVERSKPDTQFIDSMRQFVLYFSTKKAYNNFIDSYKSEIKFPNLKMVVIEDWLSQRDNLEKSYGTDAIFDITNSRVYLSNSKPTFLGSDSEIETVVSKNLLNIQPLWDLGYDGVNVSIYDIDTGINYNHVDFTGRVLLNESYSFVKTIYGASGNDDSILDVQGHGTHTAGIAAGAGIANPNYIGMAPGANIIAGKTSNERSIPTLALLAAMEYTFNTTAEVINASWGGGDVEGLRALDVAAEEVVKHGVTFVSSAGNEGPGFYTLGSPASTPNSIAVGGTTETGGLYTSSSIGPTTEGYPKPDVAAPGDSIWSCGIASNTAYVMYSGTSMASPHITGSVAVIISGLKDLGIQYNPGLLKAALMKSADPGKFNYLTFGAGIPNVYQAFNLITSATTNASGVPILLWALPELILDDYYTMPQGFHSEMFVESVSSTPSEDLPPVLTGNISSFITLNNTPWVSQIDARKTIAPYTKMYYLVFNIPDGATPGVYTGEITFETAGGVTAKTSIQIEVVEARAKILFPWYLNGWGIDHYTGQYIYAIRDLQKKGIAINEYGRWNITGLPNKITSQLLEGYDAVWLADIYDYDFTDDLIPYTLNEEIYTWQDIYDEFVAMQQFVASGGGMFLDLLGLKSETIEGVGTITSGTNITLVNELLEPFGITLSDELYEFTAPEKANVVAAHAVTENVKYIDQYGTTLSVTGSAEVLVEYKEKGVVAVYENANGGRVVAATTNFFMDTSGYINNYNDGTQNDIFTKNIFNWITAKDKIVGTYQEDATGVTFNIHALNTSTTLTATVTTWTPAEQVTTTVTLAEIAAGNYSYRLDFENDAVYTFKVVSSDDKYIKDFLIDSNAPVITTGDWVNNTKPETRIDFTIKDSLTDIVKTTVTLNDEA